MRHASLDIVTMCPEHKCEKRDRCYRYLAIPMGPKQSYLINRGALGDECNKFIKLDELHPLNKDSLAKIDNKNVELLKTWVGVEYD